MDKCCCGVSGFFTQESTEQEKLLMARVAAGDRDAFAALFDRVAPCVLGVLVRLVRQRGLAEEALQETFLQAWVQTGDYRPEAGSPRAWLLKIARSRGLDILRRENSRRREKGSQGRGCRGGARARAGLVRGTEEIVDDHGCGAPDLSSTLRERGEARRRWSLTGGPRRDAPPCSGAGLPF